MLYFLLFITVYLTLISFNQSKSRKRHLLWLNFRLDYILGTNAATIIWASSVMLIVACLAIKSSPGTAKTKQLRLDLELASQRALGHHFGARFSILAHEDSNVLIINEVASDREKKYHDAFMDGFRSGIFRHINSINEELIEREIKDPVRETSINPILNLNAREFDKIVERYDTCSTIISLIGIPQNYSGSKTWIKVASGEMLLGVLTDDVYTLGGMIFQNEITSCIIPLRRYSYDDDLEKYADPEYAFTARYLEINSENVWVTLKRHRQLFKSSRTL